MNKYCSNCGDTCPGNFRIEVRKGCYYIFCTECFHLFKYLKFDLLRIIFRNNDNFVTE